MGNDKAPVSRVSPSIAGRGVALLPRVVVVALIVGLGSFMAGLQLGQTREVSPIPAPTGSTQAPSASSQPTPVQTATPAITPSTLPAGVYHVTEIQANEIAQAARFYAAYNAGKVANLMALLSDRPRWVDCDYSTRMTVTLVGRVAVTDYLRIRFAEHDTWVVEFIQENPDNEHQVVIVPIQRESSRLLSLGAPGASNVALLASTST
ncbi:MAG TPA: hypothetical protein VIM39_13225 [Candidatus Limnocylindrales bacterium]|jgi:hypothetical protein